MRKSPKSVAIILTLLLMFIFPLTSLANNNDSSALSLQTIAAADEIDKVDEADEVEDVDEDIDVDVNEDIDEDVNEEMDEATKEDIDEDVDEDVNENTDEQHWKQEKTLIEQKKDTIEEQLDQIEEEIDALDEKIETAEENDDAALTNELKKQISDLRQEQTDLKTEMKNLINDMHKIMRERYDNNEILQLESVSQSLSNRDGLKVLPFTSLFMKQGFMKLDTPPVIKGGRVLIPIRAIAEATGSEVVWDDESHKITITKGDTVIVLTIDDDNVLINGKPYTIDVPAQLMNNRTVVPVRVIFEHLGLHVNWDPDTETVEIE